MIIKTTAIKKLLLIILLIPIGLVIFFRMAAYFRENEETSQVAPKSGFYIDYENEKIFIQESGRHNKDKLAVVFIHGTGSWSQLWAPSLKMLAKNGIYSVAIDSPPFGFSYVANEEEINYDRKTQAKRILHILDKLNIKNAILVGHSFGGRATVTAAIMRPEVVKKLVLVNIALGFGPELNENPADPPALVSTILNNKFLRETLVSVCTFSLLTKKLVESFVADANSVTPQVVNMYQKPLFTADKTHQIGLWLKDFLLNIDNQLIEETQVYSNFNFTTAIIWGEADTITPLWQAKALYKYFKNPELFIIEKVGHIPMIENEKRFNEILKKVILQ